MKLKPIIGIILLALLPAGCSKDNPVEPEVETELILTDNVGSAGGTISSDSLIIRIPPGALDSTYAVKLYHEAITCSFDSSAVTDKYRLEGLPGDLATPIDIYLKTRESVGDSGWVALGIPSMLVPGDTVGYGFDLQRAVDSSGYLYFQYPPDSAPLSAARKPVVDGFDELVFVLFGLYDVYKKSTSEHFQYVVLEEDDVDLTPLKERLEAVYDSLVNRGIDFSPIKGSIQVSVHRSFMISSLARCFLRTEGIVCEFSISYDGDYGVTDPEFLNAAAGKLCYVLPELYIDRQNLEYYYWLKVALDYWGRSKFGQLPDDCGEYYDTGELAPFVGMRTELYNEVMEQTSHGRGMVSLFKYLDNTQSPFLLANALEEMKVYNAHIFEALDNNTTDGLDLWWPDYFRELIDGNLCPIDVNGLIASQSGTFAINTVEDTLHTFSVLYHDMMAKVFYVALNYSGFDAEDKLRFTVFSNGITNDKLSVLLFTYKNNQLTFLTQGDELNVANIKAMHDDSRHLVAVVINSNYNRTYFYPSVNDIDLKVEYVRETGPTYEYCKIRCSVKPEWERYDGTTWWDTQNLLEQWAFEGTTTNGVFTGTPDPMYHGSSATGTMTVTFDPNTLEILTFTADVSIPTGTNSRLDFGIAGHNVPNTYADTWLANEVIGPTTCAYISSRTFFSLYNITDYKWEMLKSFICEDDTHFLRIELHDLE